MSSFCLSVNFKNSELYFTEFGIVINNIATPYWLVLLCERDIYGLAETLNMSSASRLIQVQKAVSLNDSFS